MMTSEAITAASAGTWKLGDLTVNRVGFGAMRLTGSAAFDLGTPSDRDRSITVLRRAVELGAPTEPIRSLSISARWPTYATPG
jgi:pyridoxine 4-dehydrogenase